MSEPWASRQPSAAQIEDFREREAGWIEDYAVFCAVRDRMGTDDWREWDDDGLRRCDGGAVARWRTAHPGAVLGHILQQWRLHEAFRELRKKANDASVELIGDLPFYLPLQSPLVWANQRCFDIAKGGRLLQVSGVQAGRKEHFGRQIWGHPLYAWGKWGAKKRIIRLWRTRLTYFAKFYDTMRLDHATGFFFYAAMDMTGRGEDVFRSGPGDKVLRDLIRFGARRGLRMFAEDAGGRVVELRKALRSLDIPGMRMLRFAYNEKQKIIHPSYGDIANYPVNAYTYTTTHDTVTLLGYIRLLDKDERAALAEHTGVAYSEDEVLFAARLREAIVHSPSHHSIVPLQDWLLIEDRINVPGTERDVGDPNWRWVAPVAVEDLPTPASL